MIQKKMLEASFVRHDENEDLHRLAERHAGRRMALALLLALLVAGVFWLRNSQSRHVKEMLLRQQLWQLRSAAMIYHAKFGRLPPDLVSMVGVEYADPATGKRIKLLENIEVDEDGEIVDPMGSVYEYDKTTGTVRSTATCCRNW